MSKTLSIDDVVHALSNIGGEAHLDEIVDELQSTFTEFDHSTIRYRVDEIIGLSWQGSTIYDGNGHVFEFISGSGQTPAKWKLFDRVKIEELRGISFVPPISTIVNNISGRHYVSLCGSNNSGKSLILKQIKGNIGRTAYLAGPVRFYHVAELASQKFNPQDYDNWENQFYQNANNSEQNFEANFIDLGRIISSLTDSKRDLLFKICSDLIGGKFSLKRRDPDNELSFRYVDVDGQNLALASTGTRLLMTLLGLCMDEQFSVLLIDEPELGLSPRVQMTLSQFLSDETMRKQAFPHLKSVIVSTHSHLFIDRKEISNNYIVEKSDHIISATPLKTIGELHNLQFNLLGNTFESLFLPSAFVIVEGKTDQPYIERCVSIRFPGRKILVINGQGDVKRVFHNLKTTLGDIEKSPLRDRIYIVLDSIHTTGTVDDLVKMGAKSSNVVVWDNNGIEYLYPIDAMSGIFSCRPERLSELLVESDNVSLNGISKRKVDLSGEVVNLVSSTSVFPSELVDKLISPLAKAIGEA